MSYGFWDALSSHPAAATWNPMVPFGGAPSFTWQETGDASTDGAMYGYIGPVDSATVPTSASEYILDPGPWDGSFEFHGAFKFPVGISSDPADARAAFTIKVNGSYSAAIQFLPVTTGGTMTLWSGTGIPTAGSNAVQQARNWVSGGLYQITWQHNRGSNGQDRVKVWLYPNPEPASWDLVLGLTGSPSFSGSNTGPLFEISVGSRFAHITDAWGWTGMYMIVNDVGPCGCVPVEPCNQAAILPYFIQDDFTRSGAWSGSTATNGQHWVVSGSGADSTDGSAGVITTSRYFAEASSGQLPTSVTFGPGVGTDLLVNLWVDTVGNEVAALTVQTLYALSLDNGANLSCSITYYGPNYPTYGGQTQIVLSYQNANGDTGGSDTIYTGGAQNRWNRLRVRMAADGIRAKLWALASTEPAAWTVKGDSDWTASASNDLADGPSGMAVGFTTESVPDRIPGSPDVTYEMKFDDFALLPSCAEPTPNQPVQDVFVGTGDGATTNFFTGHAYNPVSLEPEVDGIIVPFDPTDPATGEFHLLTPPGVGARVTVTFRAAP